MWMNVLFPAGRPRNHQEARAPYPEEERLWLWWVNEIMLGLVCEIRGWSLGFLLFLSSLPLWYFISALCLFVQLVQFGQFGPPGWPAPSMLPDTHHAFHVFHVFISIISWNDRNVHHMHHNECSGSRKCQTGHRHADQYDQYKKL